MFLTIYYTTIPTSGKNTFLWFIEICRFGHSNVWQLFHYNFDVCVWFIRYTYGRQRFKKCSGHVHVVYWRAVMKGVFGYPWEKNWIHHVSNAILLHLERVSSTKYVNFTRKFRKRLLCCILYAWAWSQLYKGLDTKLYKSEKHSLSTARCYAERGIATASRPSVRDVELSWSQSHRLKIFKNNFTVS